MACADNWREMSFLLARLGSRARSSLLPVGVGLLLATGLVLLGTIGSGAWAGGSSSPPSPSSDFAISAIPTMEIAGTTAPEQDGRPGHIIVGLERGASLPDLSGYGLSEASAVGIDDIHVLELAPIGISVPEVLQRVQALPGVAWAQAEVALTACVVPNDTFYAPSAQYPQGQWGMWRVGMPSTWDITPGSAGVIVAIIDTGINKDAPDFAGRIVDPYNAMTERTDWPEWKDNKGHGTAVAGVAVAQGNDSQGIAGVAWNVKIMPVKIADLGETYDYVLARGIKWAVDHGADVINISFAGSDTTTVETAAINYALSHGVPVIASAGNTGYSSSGNIAYPAALPGVIAVGATSRVPMDARADFSATGPELDIAAPGKEIISHSLSGFSLWSGTSFSAPLVTGVAALLLSVNPSLTPNQVTAALTSTADDLGDSGWDASFGWGMVDADEALDQASGGTTTSSSTTTSSTTTTTSSTTTTTLPPTTTTTITVPSTTTTTAPRFVDVSPATTPYAEEIGYLASLGIVVGKGDGHFYPDSPLMRQQFAKMIVLTMGYPVGETEMAPFGDVSHLPGDLYPYHYVAVAWKNAITQGTRSGYFSPYLDLNRAQMITMVVRAAGLPEPPSEYVPPFPNFSLVHYPYARTAASAGILDALVGMGPDYDFLAPASRGEVCALLNELLR